MGHYVSANVTNMNLFIRSTADCNVIIRAYEFQNIHIGYVISLTTSGNLAGNQLVIKTDGVSNLVLANIVYNKVEVLLSGSSNVALSGLAQRLEVIQLSQGTIDARFLETNYATVFTKNSGLVKVKSNDYLSIATEGLSNINWCSPRVDIKDNSEIYHIPSQIVSYCE